MYIYIYVYMYIYRKEIYLTVEVPLPTDKRVPDLQLVLNYINNTLAHHINSKH